MLNYGLAVSSLLHVVALSAFGWQPTGKLDALYDDELLPRLRPGVKAASFSSYDRTGGNNDGFSGAYSKLREEDGNSVIAEMEGPGCIQRLWLTHSAMDEDGLLDRKGEHIRIYLDGAATPALDVPLQRLFDNSLAHFPQPIAGQGIGGYYSYIPIPYKKSCKVVIDGLGVRFYQLNYVTFPTAEGVKSFEMDLSAMEASALQRAIARWRDPVGELQGYGGGSAEISVVHQPGGKEPVNFVHTLDAPEPMLVRGMTLSGLSPYEVEQSEIEIVFSDLAVPAIRLPLTLFFGQAFGAPPYSSLMFGFRGGVYYNRLPFVLTGECTIRLHSILPLEGKLTIFQSPLAEPVEEYGALGAQVNESLPTVAGVYHPLLDSTGQGHLVGSYLITEGPIGLPFWLEGDDQFYLDGELRIHGTGSEDYFNCGWYALPGRLNGPEALPSHGFPVYGETAATMRAAAFRWHFSDPVPFDKNITFQIEHGEANRHIANYRSVTYYYLK